MSRSTKLVGAASAVTAIGAVALTVAVVFGAFGLGPQRAEAGISPIEPGSLGVTERVEVLSSPVDVADKIEVAEAPAEAAALAAPLARKAAPLPKPKPKPAARPAARAAASSAPSRSGESSGWSSAKASWYGPGFYGRKTASGAVLTQGMMNVAHKSLPFGTRIQFEYKGRTAIAVVNDRGPFVGGRVFDLGPGTATALGFGGVGTVKYRILGR